jgi:hypothetical protein
MARDGRGILRIAFACDTLSSKSGVSAEADQPTTTGGCKAKFLRECDAVHTRPNSSGHFRTIQTGPPGAGNDRSRHQAEPLPWANGLDLSAKKYGFDRGPCRTASRADPVHARKYHYPQPRRPRGLRLRMLFGDPRRDGQNDGSG